MSIPPPRRPIPVYVLTAEHETNPGRVLRVFSAWAKAVAHAADLQAENALEPGSSDEDDDALAFIDIAPINLDRTGADAYPDPKGPTT